MGNITSAALDMSPLTKYHNEFSYNDTKRTADSLVVPSAYSGACTVEGSARAAIRHAIHARRQRNSLNVCNTLSGKDDSTDSHINSKPPDRKNI